MSMCDNAFSNSAHLQRMKLSGTPQPFWNYTDMKTETAYKNRGPKQRRLKYMSFKKLVALATFMIVGVTSNVFAAPTDVVQGQINLSGNVPVFFELWVRGVPGDLDLSGFNDVNDRLLGILHVKYNQDIASLIVKSSTASGKLQNAGVDWTGVMTYEAMGDAATCKTIGTTTAGVAGTVVSIAAADIVSGGAGKDLHSVTAADLAGTVSSGLEEDCSFTGTWDAPDVALPLAGVYKDVLTFTMTSE